MKKESFWAEKSVFCRKIGGHFQTGEQGWVPLFPVSEGAGGAVPPPPSLQLAIIDANKINNHGTVLVHMLVPILVLGGQMTYVY